MRMFLGAVEMELGWPVGDMGLLEEGADIKDFVSVAGKKVEIESPNVVKIKHNNQATFRCPPQYASGTFEKSVRVRKYKDTALGKKGQKISDKTEGQETFTLKTGESKTVVNREGKVREGIRDYHYDRDTTVELISVERIVEVTTTDPNTGKPVTTTTVQKEVPGYSGGGSAITKTPTGVAGIDWKMVGIGVVVIGSVIGVAYFITKKKPAKQIATTPAQMAGGA